MSPTKEIERRFWTKVEKSDGCWLWISARATNGYGKFGDWKNRKTWAAHRLAWTLTIGPIPPGLEVCHSCNVKLCVRPGHLYLAPHATNMADARRDGLYAVGARHPRARLTEEQVRCIRLQVAAGESRSAVARQYGLHSTAVSAIVRGALWRDVAGAVIPSASSVDLFLAERCILDPGRKVLVGDLYAAYTAWATSAGVVPLNKFPFGRQIGLRGMKHRQKHPGRRCWGGLDLRAA